MKKFLYLILISILALTVTVSLVACANNNGGNQGGEEIGGEVTLDYTQDTIKTTLEEYRNNGGYFCKLKYYSSNNANAPTVSNLSFGANGEIFYFKDMGFERIYDLTSEAEYVTYEKTLTGNWKKAVTPYGENGTKAQMLSTMDSIFLDGFKFLTQYTEYIQTGNTFKKIGTTVIASHNCVQYRSSVNAADLNASYSCYIEESTGLCFKSEISGSTTEEKANSAFECTEFLTSYEIAIPTVEE